MKAIIAQAALLTSLLSSLAESLSFIRSCRVESPIYELVYNGNQLVPREDLGDLSLRTTNIPPYLDLANGTIIEARLCDCHIRSRYHPQRKSVFCPLSLSHCAVPGNRRDWNLYCVSEETKGQVFLQYCLFIAAAWTLCILIWLFFSVSGRYVLSGVLATCTPFNQHLATRLEQKNPPLAQHMMRRNIHIRRRLLEDSNDFEEHRELTAEMQAVTRLAMEEQERFNSNIAPEQGNDGVNEEGEKNRVATSLRLRYYIYENLQPKQATSPLNLLRPSADPTEGNEECTICYQEVEDGQRVSDLHCGHTFHVSCLKEWCARRNVCPLCKAADICEPIYDEAVHEEIL